MAAALMVPYCLGSCSSSENADNIIDEKVPLEMGTITVSGSIDSRAYDATAGDGYTRWQWKPGDKILITAIPKSESGELDFSNAKECYYELASDGSTWNVGAGQTPIYLQDVDGGNYAFFIDSNGGYLIEDIQDQITLDDGGNRMIADQSSAKQYIASDFVSGRATLGSDNSDATTYRKLSAQLGHMNVDIVVNLKRGIGWGNTEAEANAAFKTHLTSAATPMIYAEPGWKDDNFDTRIDAGYRIKPYMVVSPDGSMVTCRAHISIYATSYGYPKTTWIHNGSINDAPILQLITPTGAKLNATYSLTAEQIQQAGAGSRLTINLVYDNYGVLHTQSVVIGKWNDGGTTNIDGEYSGTLD